MYLLGLIKLFEQKGLLITLVNMLIAQFGLKKKKPSRSGAQHPIYATGSEQLGEGKPFSQIILLLNSVVGLH